MTNINKGLKELIIFFILFYEKVKFSMKIQFYDKSQQINAHRYKCLQEKKPTWKYAYKEEVSHGNLSTRKNTQIYINKYMYLI